MSEGTLVEIERLGGQGDGLGVSIGEGGPALFIATALPGETWDVGTDPPRLVTAHPDRQPARCPHFLRCGGCTAHHMPDDIYAAWKRSIIADALRHQGLDCDVAALVTVRAGSRRRAVLTAERRDGRFDLGFHAAGTHRLEPITACAVLDPRIMDALPGLAVLARLLLRGDADGRLTVLATDSGLDIVLEGETKPLSADRRADLADLARAQRFARISAQGSGGAEPIITLEQPRLTFAGAVVVPPPGAFVQAVPEAEREIADRVVAGIGKAKRAADLFCGIGTFSFPLARRARVTAVDSVAPALEALRAGTRSGAEGLKPIETLMRDLFREPLSRKELSAFDAVVFDPPRAGAAAQSAMLAKSDVPRIVAVSCQPSTLARDLRTLADGGYRIDSVTPIDQFVFSAHVEAIAVLSRK